MARPLCIKYPGAIYHAMSRGNAQQAIFRNDADRQHLLEYLEGSVIRLPDVTDAQATCFTRIKRFPDHEATATSHALRPPG